MSDENVNTNSGPAAADLSALSDELTLPQIRTRLSDAEAELAHLADPNTGDRSLAASRRVRDLREFVLTARAAVTEIEGTEFGVPDPEPAPAEDAPAPAEEPPAEPAAVETAPPAPAAQEPAPAVDADAEVADALAETGADVIAVGSGAVEVLDPQDDRVPMFATIGAGTDPGDASLNGATSFGSVADRLRNLTGGQIQRLGAGERMGLWRTDRLAGADLPRLGDDVDVNTSLILDDLPEPIAAAAGLSICGEPIEIQVQGCPIDTTTPFLDSIAGRNIPADNCQVKWRRPLSLSRIGASPQIWTPCDQELVDPNDSSTWKPLGGEVPACEDFCYAEPFDTVLGMIVTMNDQLCRPERVEEASNLIEVMHAVLLEQSAMNIFDANVGADGHFAFDASSTNLGAFPSFVYAIHAVLARTGLTRTAPRQNWTMALDPAILATLGMDMWLAQENGAQAMQMLADAMAAVGINNIVTLKEDGACEGVLTQGYNEPSVICDLKACDIAELADPAAPAYSCVPFGGGHEIPAMPSRSRIRLFNPNNWVHGNRFIVDYAIRTDASLARRNQAELFGERRDLLFRANGCESHEMVIDIDNLCATGARVDSTGTSFPCPAPVAGGTGTTPWLS